MSLQDILGALDTHGGSLVRFFGKVYSFTRVASLSPRYESGKPLFARDHDHLQLSISTVQFCESRG